MCHHLDYELLGLDESFHTTGFFKRESYLYRRLLGDDDRSRPSADADSRRFEPGLSRARYSGTIPLRSSYFTSRNTTCPRASKITPPISRNPWPSWRKLFRRMEQGEQSLEQTLADFERGMVLSEQCRKSLDAARQRVEKLVGKHGDL